MWERKQHLWGRGGRVTTPYTVAPSQKLPATGMTSSHNMTRGWEHFFGIWKIFRSSSAETGNLMGPLSYNIKQKRGYNLHICRVTEFFCRILLFRVFLDSTERANSLLLQNITLLSIFCMYYTRFYSFRKVSLYALLKWVSLIFTYCYCTFTWLKLGFNVQKMV